MFEASWYVNSCNTNQQDPAACTAVKTSESASLPGAAYRACTADEAALPTIGQLLTSSPQLTKYIEALRTAGLGNIPGSSVTGERTRAQMLGIRVE